MSSDTAACTAKRPERGEKNSMSNEPTSVRVTMQTLRLAVANSWKTGFDAKMWVLEPLDSLSLYYR